MRRRCAAVLVLWLAPGFHAAAQTPPPDLAEIEFEDLIQLRVQEVFGASDRLQPVTEAPSSVSIVTAQDISRHGYRTLADILRGVRGFYVTDDRNYSYVGARGFNRPGDYSTRVLLLVNGHRVNDNVYDQANVGAEFLIDAAMFERVEIIRGPASSLYGTNSLFATVNVITRTGASLNGASIHLGTGTLGTQLVRAAGGRRLKNGMDFVLSGTHERSAGVTALYLPEFDTPGNNSGLAENLDGEHATHLYGRFGLKDLTVTSGFAWRNKYVPTASYETAFNAHAPPEETTDRKLTVMAQYVRQLGKSRVTTEAAMDYFRYDGVYPYGGDAPEDALVPFRDGGSGLRWSARTIATRPMPGRQMLTFGGEFVDNVNQNQWGAYPFPSDENFVLDQSSRQISGYVQDEIKLRPWLLLNGGLRHDQFSEFSRTTPRGAVIVMPSSNHSLKYLYGQAFRAPNVYELYYYSATESLEPESIGTHEWVWEAYFGERLRTVVSTYRYRALQLIDFRATDPDFQSFEGVAFANSGAIRAAGLELESEFRLKRGAQALASYTLQDARGIDPDSVRLTNSPRHMAKLRFTIPGPRTGSSASFEWQYMSSRTTLAGSTVSHVSLANANFALPVGRAVTLTGQVRNLFNARYADPGSDEHLGDSIEQNGRTARVGIRWSFWDPR